VDNNEDFELVAVVVAFIMFLIFCIIGLLA